MGETTLGNAFQVLEQETGYRLLYSPSLIKPDQTLQVSFKQTPLQEILESMLWFKCDAEWRSGIQHGRPIIW
ncbi:hypothetical protein GCM10023231_12990 [Olivibacter ginsenosidimutans]|uniref:DUF4974 domain-containing protein n=1 Tax=Olivibacter ginsenosidimutans TaxID=1176537 RepID=A0ABP9AV43_9SPHI